MRMTKNRCKISGLVLSNVSIDIIRPTEVGVGLRGKFILMTEEGIVAGTSERSSEWSEEVQKALEVLVEAMEKDQASHTFDEVKEADPEKTLEERNNIQIF